jgi:hypothetical protein
VKRQTNLPVAGEVNKPAVQTEATDTDLADKKLFVEPTVSVPSEVLEATTFFQQPTIESSTT